MARLRSECPWTREQTHESLRQYLIEEAYEAVDVLGLGDGAAMRDELGDVLMQVVFHAAIAESDGEGWNFDDVATAIADKLVRRSPHVFGDVIANDAAAVDALWQQIKAQERREASTREREVEPLPALMAAQKHLAAGYAAPIGDSLLQRLFALVAEANAAGIDLEVALRQELRTTKDESESCG